MTDNAESAFARWSRLKRQRTVNAAAPRRSGTAAIRPASEHAPETTPNDQAAPPPAEKIPSDLPDIASLNRDSDFSPFLRRDVPEGLHRQALRALWRSDPMFSLRDGLTAYDEDYTGIGKVEQVVCTAYRVGQGYLGEDIREQPADSVPREREASAESAPADPAGAANDPPASADAADETSVLEHRQ
jgi:hypothetical protein